MELEVAGIRRTRQEAALRIVKQTGVGIAVLSPAVVCADITQPADAVSTFQSFSVFTDQVRAILADVLVSPVGDFAESLFIFFAALLIFQRLGRYIWGGLTLSEIVETVVLIVVVRIMMIMYGPVTSLIWDWADGFGGGIQEIAVGSSDLFFVPTFIKNIFDRIAVADVSIFDGIRAAIAVVMLSIIAFFMSVLAFFAGAWGIWGYAVAKLIGWMFIPTLMFKRLQFLFDGWLRFFFGFMLYIVIARVNLSLSAVAFGLYFNLPTYSAPTSPYTFPVDNFGDFFGVAAIAIISIVALISTGKFAATIAGGVGGLSDGIRGLALMAGRLAR